MGVPHTVPLPDAVGDTARLIIAIRELQRLDLAEQRNHVATLWYNP